MPEQVIRLRRMCSALLPDAKTNNILNNIENFRTLGLWNMEIESARKAFGGLWVGGSLYISKQSLIFKPNAVNAALHEGDVSLNIPFDLITNFRCRFGLLTRIIEVDLRTVKQSFRCYGAAELSEILEVALTDSHACSDATKSIRLRN